MTSRKILLLLTTCFFVTVLIPTYLSWGEGVRFTLFNKSIHHHRATATIGVFTLILFAAWLSSKTFRNELTEIASDYDKLAIAKVRQVEIVLLVVLGAWLAFLKWHQSYLLETNVYDHGIFLNVFWNSMHDSWYWNSFKHMNFLGDHFSPFLGLLALPFLFGNFESWPLIAQTIAMVLALYFLTYIATFIHPLRHFERLLLILFFVVNEFFQRVHRYDIHPIAFGLPVILGIYILSRKKSIFLWPSLAVAYFCIQEDVSLMILGMALFLILSTNDKLKWSFVAILSLVALWVNVKLLIPHFAGMETAYTVRYQSMGGNLNNIFSTFLTKPHVPMRYLFSSLRLLPLLEVFGSFGFFPLLSVSSVALIPPILEHSLSDLFPQFGYRFHYAANLLPFLMVGTVVALCQRKIPYKIFIPLILLLAAYSSFNNQQYLPPAKRSKVTAIRDFAAQVDENEIVSVQGSIGIPFAFRKKVYMFPDVGDATMIVLSPDSGSWPLTPDELQEQITGLRARKDWLEDNTGQILVFRKKRRVRNFL